jgi:phage anti-repressor protein
MNEIVAQSTLPLWNVSVAHGTDQAVDARDLHRFLAVGKDFSNWVKDQIQRGQFTSGVDFVTVAKKGDDVINDLSNLRPGLDYTVEYYLTLEMAKHVAMLSGTTKGKEAREYFLACERKAKEAAVLPLQVAQPPEQLASTILRAELEIAALLEVPKHIAQVEAVKAVERRTGIDYSVYLLSAPAQSNIPAEEIMYEPNDMARVIGLVDGAQFNLWLKNGGYQVKTAEGWVPTEAGAPYCVTHQWKTQYKTGQNLKWSKKFVLSLLPKDWQVPG